MVRASSRLVILGSLIVFLGFTVFALSEVQVEQSKYSPADPAVFQETVVVRFEGDAMHGAYGALQWRKFSLEASLKGETTYIMTFLNDWFNVVSIEINDQDGHSVPSICDFSFNSTTEGVYTFSVLGCYQWSLELGDIVADPGSNGYISSYEGWHTYTEYDIPIVDENVKVSIFRLEETTETVSSFAFLLPVTPVLLALGTIMPVLAYIREHKASPNQ